MRGKVLLAVLVLACAPTPTIRTTPQKLPIPEPPIQFRDPCKSDPFIGGRDLLRKCHGFEHPTTVSRELPAFSCRGDRAPWVKCEARYVDPFDPTWRVYYPGTDDVVDLGRGVTVYRTLPSKRFARFSMCVTPDYCLQAWGGWFDGQALFHR